MHPNKHTRTPIITTYLVPNMISLSQARWQYVCFHSPGGVMQHQQGIWWLVTMFKICYEGEHWR